MQLIDGHEKRISMIEAQGSPKFSEHFKLDDDRNDRTKADIKRLEDMVMKYSEIGAKVDGLRYQIDSMQKMIEVMHQRQNQE